MWAHLRRRMLNVAHLVRIVVMVLGVGEVGASLLGHFDVVVMLAGGAAVNGTWE